MSSDKTVLSPAGTPTPTDQEAVEGGGPGPVLDIEICDPHHHLFDSSSAAASARYTLDEFRGDARGLPLVQSIYVECSEHYRADGPTHLRPVGETEWLAESLPEDSVVAGMVAHADLFDPAHRETIAAHLDTWPGRVKGIRHRTAWDPDPALGTTRLRMWEGMLTMRSFREGVSAVGDAGLPFDAFVYFHQLPEVEAMARAVPETLIILDHMGGLLGVGPYAGKGRDVAERWRAHLIAASRCPNIVLKIGGLGRPLSGLGWDRAAVKPGPADIARTWSEDVLWAIELFGADRCMFESNFPVDRVSFSYSTCWQAFDRITGSLSVGERKDLFHGTAARAYRLDPRPNTGKD